MPGTGSVSNHIYNHDISKDPAMPEAVIYISAQSNSLMLLL